MVVGTAAIKHTFRGDVYTVISRDREEKKTQMQTPDKGNISGDIIACISEFRPLEKRFIRLFAKAVYRTITCRSTLRNQKNRSVRLFTHAI